MFAANSYNIRPATADDTFTLRRWADRKRQQPLAGRLLIGEINGQPAAAISLLDGRTVVDPSAFTGHLLANLRIRASSVWAYEATPSLRDRMLRAMAAPTAPAEQDEPQPAWAQA
jgi:hypothetical protein